MSVAFLLVAALLSTPWTASDTGQSPAPPANCGTVTVSGSAMAYDSDRRLVVLFGGVTTGDSSSGATWGWNGKAWQCLAPANARSPQPRNAAMLAYDDARHVLVLYGGRQGREAFRDTWELSAKGWTRTDTAGPTSEPHGVMAYDQSTRAVLLYHAIGNRGPVRATWSWDGRRWMRRAFKPNDEIPDAMLATARARPAMLLTTRATTVADAFAIKVYEWRGDRWSPVAVTGKLPVFSPQAPAARTPTGAVVYAGFEPGGGVRSWVLENGAWRGYEGLLPPRRRGAAMVFDPTRGVAVLHGGDDGTSIRGDTWEWGAGRWRQIK